MGWIEWSVELLTWTGLAFAFIVTYLKANKVWIRRFDRNVADSISVSAVVLGLVFNTLPNWVKFTFVHFDAAQSGRESIKLAAAVIFFAIGIGYWARRDQQRSLGSLLKRTLRLENREATGLARAFIHPVGPRQVLRILDQIALVDRHYNESEHRFISAFAEVWNIDHENDLVALQTAIQQKSQAEMYLDLRVSVASYLAMHPPGEQVTQLMDVIRSLMIVDTKLSDEENFILGELKGMASHYLQSKNVDSVYEVIVVPQQESHHATFRSMVQNAELVDRCGGQAYVVDRYFSKLFAEMVCDQYRNRQFFATIESCTIEDQAASPEACEGSARE